MINGSKALPHKYNGTQGPTRWEKWKGKTNLKNIWNINRNIIIHFSFSFPRSGTILGSTLLIKQ